MFDKFGEFDSYEELNRAADGFRDEGDRESLFALAEENGIDKEDVEDYLEDGVMPFTTERQAAFGKILVELEDGKNKGVSERMALRVILDMVSGMCIDPDMAAAVRKKRKRAADILKAMRNEASKNRSGNTGVACGTDRDLCNIIRAYYIDGDANKEIRKLYEVEK
jgi:hypothetical protein